MAWADEMNLAITWKADDWVDVISCFVFGSLSRLYGAAASFVRLFVCSCAMGYGRSMRAMRAKAEPGRWLPYTTVAEEL